MKKVILVLVDALKFEYISKSNTPFLYRLSKKNICAVKPSGGFCERSEIFTGLNPIESGFFTAIAYDEKLDYFNNSNSFFGLFHLERYLKKLMIFHQNIIIRKLNSIIRKIIIKLFYLSRSKNINPYKIPLDLIPFLTYTEDKISLSSSKVNLKNKTIFQLLEIQNKTYSLDCFTSLNSDKQETDELRLKKALKLVELNSINFIPVYINEIDKVGHEYGPDSNEIQKSLINVDKILENFSNMLIDVDPNSKVLFLGDHGMTSVYKSINFEKIMLQMSKKTKLKLGDDYFYFLDSTIFRLWTSNKLVLKKIKNYLKTQDNLIKYGSFIFECNKEFFGIPNNDLKYGELLWWSNPGVIIFPDFFRSNYPPKGMHGYDPSHPCSKGVLISNNLLNNQNKEIQLKSLYKILKKELEL